jgi:hypothetical protein
VSALDMSPPLDRVLLRVYREARVLNERASRI